MSFTDEQKGMLSAPLSTANVKRNPRGYDYVEAYHCENEANRIFGFDGWDRETELTPISEAVVGDKHRVYYRAKVRITVRTPGGSVVVREGCGYGSGIDKDLGQAHESALKEAESDAEKRALKTFGNPFGQALYDKEKTNVETPPAQPSAEEMAIRHLRACSADADLFKDAWAKNKDAWKGVLDGPAYARLVAVMKAEAAKFSTPKPTEDFGLNGDAIPNFGA